MTTSNPPLISLIFVDTEFTSLGEAGPSEIISIGAIDYATGRTFYVESADFDPSKVSEFTQHHVIPLLQRGESVRDFPDLCTEFFSFLTSFNTPVMLAMDSSWDWMWIRYLAEQHGCMDRPVMDIASQAPLWPSILKDDYLHCSWAGLAADRKAAAKKARYSYFSERKLIPHHALVDAEGILMSFKAAIGPLFKNADINERNLARFQKMFDENPTVAAGSRPPFEELPAKKLFKVI